MPFQTGDVFGTPVRVEGAGDRAMALALEMSLEHIREQNVEPHRNSVEAYIWYNSKEE